MYQWSDEYAVQARMNDRLHEAEVERMVRQARAGRPAGQRLYGRMLAGLGRQLETLAGHLHSRHGSGEL